MTGVTRKPMRPAAAGAFLATVTLAAAVLLAPAGASASTSAAGLYITGAGFGHGVGMSQYGAAGYALHGETYQQILRNYYSQTTLGYVNPSRTVTVLLKSQGAAAFSGATRIKGVATKELNVNTNYSVLVAGTKLRIVSGGRTFGTFTAPLQVSGPGPLKLLGTGTYLGALLFRPSAAGSGVMTVNALGLDDYVRGVVGAEMPTSWPQQALDAQAVAARSYAVASGASGPDFDVYDNTRSQMYEGIAAETPATNTAVDATAGKVVEYDGRPAVTYFFASSGGQTESVQNVWAGVAPEAWLVGRSDPYDDSYNNPYYRWKLNLKLGSAAAKLRKLIRGSLKGIKIVRRGVSPRIVQAKILGSKGATTATGAQLQTVLGTPSTWMSFTTVTAKGVETSGSPPSGPTPTTTITTPVDGGGGLGPSVRGHSARAVTHSTRAPGYGVSGTVYPVVARETVTVQYDTGGDWMLAASGIPSATGRYSIPVSGPGIYRVIYHGTVGPKIAVG